MRFALDDSVVSNVEAQVPTPKSAEALKVLLLALSPSRSGVCDELLALIRMGVLRLENGIPTLARKWWTDVDVLMLDDMFENWGLDADPSGKYAIVDSIRKPLGKHWKKTEEGWVLDGYDVVYEDSEFDAWRLAFEDKQQSQSDNIDGVGRFGI
jgi:hypothetical protein